MSKNIAIDRRTSAFSRNGELENLLKDINGLLWRCEETLLRQDVQQKFPLVLVVGPMRSGTTLLMQWLANTGFVAYPTNLLSRFYQAPIIGAKIQLLLTEPRYNFRDELGEFLQQSTYTSENGKTKGALAPNEFWYFWRRFLSEPERDAWTDDELRESLDTQTMMAELAGIMDVFQKPFAAKGLLFNYNIPFLDSVFEKAVFVQIKRDPVANVASVLDARKRQLGSVDAWYSFKIPEYELLRTLEPISQAAGQVYCINRAVDRGLIGVDESRKVVVNYGEFCQNPQAIFEELANKAGFPDSQYVGPQNFSQSRVMSSSERRPIEEAILKIQDVLE